MGSRSAVRGWIVAVVGVVLLTVAALLRWVVVPDQAQLPADTNTTRQYEGTAKVLLNPQALSAGDFARALLNGVPVTASRTVKVLATSGSAAQVSDTRTLTTNGQTVGSTNATYAVNRTSLEPTTNHPADWNVVPAQGLTVSWPIGAKKQDYTGWVNETQTTVPLKYLREESHGGIDTYVYEGDVPAAPIKDPQVLGNLPKALPGSTLGALSNFLPLTPDEKSALAGLLPALTQPVPISYTYEAKSTFWVAPATGIVVDNQREEIRQAGLSFGGGPPNVTIPVYDVTTKNTDQSVQDAATQARNNNTKLTTFGVTLPLVIGGIGLVLVVLGVVLGVRGRRDYPAEHG